MSGDVGHEARARRRLEVPRQSPFPRPPDCSLERSAVVRSRIDRTDARLPPCKAVVVQVRRLRQDDRAAVDRAAQYGASIANSEAGCTLMTRESDAASNAGSQAEVDIAERRSLQRWSAALGVTAEALESAVRAVGPRVDRIKDYLAGGMAGKQEDG